MSQVSSSQFSENARQLYFAGYTILDGLILFNGSVYLVSDHPNILPPVSSIVSPLVGIDLKYLPSRHAASILGTFGGK
jgi:hypothetical protein